MIKEIFEKLFLAKEIKAKDGTMVFRRWRVLKIPYLRIYIHQLFESDKDNHLHSHPWNYFTYVLKGGYLEESLPANPDVTKTTVSQRLKVVLKGCWNGHKADEFHRITLLEKPTTTLFVAYGEGRSWGYYVPNSKFPNNVVPNAHYRQNKAKYASDV